MNIYPPKVSSRLLVIERLYFYDESLILWKLLSCLDCCCLFVWSFTESKRLRGAASTRQRGRRPVQRTLVHPAGEVSPEITTRRTCRCPLRPRFSFVLRNNRERKTKRRCPNFTRSRESGSRLPLDLLERKVTRVGFLLFFFGNWIFFLLALVVSIGVNRRKSRKCTKRRRTFFQNGQKSMESGIREDGIDPGKATYYLV